MGLTDPVEAADGGVDEAEDEAGAAPLRLRCARRAEMPVAAICESELVVASPITGPCLAAGPVFGACASG